MSAQIDAATQNLLNARWAELNNIEAEAALLGAILIDNSGLEYAREHLTPDDFFEPVHQRIYRAIVRFVDEGRTVTPITLKPIFDRDPAMKELGGIVYLARLTQDMVGMLAFNEIVKQVADLGRLRSLWMGTEMTIDGYLAGDTLVQATQPLDDALAKAVSAAASVPSVSAGGMVRKVIERSTRITENMLGDRVGPTCSNIKDLNTLFGPLEPGSMVIIAGRPGMGKTTLASSAAWGYAANGHCTEYFAAEGTEDTLGMRLTADLSLDHADPIPHESIKHDRLTQQQREDLPRLEQIAESLPINYQVIGRIDVRKFRSYVARAKARWEAKGRKLEVVFIDYLQLLGASENGRAITDGYKRVTAISNALLDIAKDMGVVLIALSQLSRALEQRPDKRPVTSDLRESGDLEQDADVVLLLYREEYYLEQAKPQAGVRDYDAELEDWNIRMGKARDRLDLILGKNRHGERKTRQVKFFGKYYAVRGLDYSEDNLWAAESGAALDFSKL